MSFSPLLEALQRYGPLPSKLLRQRLRASQSSFQRETEALQDHLIRLGKARATRWAARREIDGLLTPIPVYEVDSVGTVALLATLYPVEPFGHAVVPADPSAPLRFVQADPSELSQVQSLDLPWFLQDQKPEGYMGRAWLSAHPELNYPANLHTWTGNDVLRYLAHHGDQAPGSLLIGADSKVRFERSAPPVATPEEQVAALYPQRAHAALTGAPHGAPAGGEQPKFTARISSAEGHVHDVIVKFTAPTNTDPGRRWADLLTAEHVAHQVLEAIGVSSCTSRIVDVGQRRFLEVQRFDRHGERGRSGVVSLHPFDRSGAGSQNRSWSLVTQHLVADGELSSQDHETVRWLEAFGHLIANTDMHLGNLSLLHQGGRITGLAPVYDMLPMFHTPRRTGEVVDTLYPPWQQLNEAPGSAIEAARLFWATLVQRPDISDRYRALAQAQHDLI